MRTRTPKAETAEVAARTRKRLAKTTLTKEVQAKVIIEEAKPSRAYATMWIAMIVCNKLEGDLTPMRDIVTTKAINMSGAIKNMSAYYNNARRVDATQFSVIMIMTFSEFIHKRMCIDADSMPMIDTNNDFSDLPDDIVEEIHRVGSMPREAIDAEIKALYEAERNISVDKPWEKPKHIRSDFTMSKFDKEGKRIPEPHEKAVDTDTPTTPRKRTRTAAAPVEAEPPKRQRKRR